MDDSFNYPRGGRQRMSRDRYSISSDLFPTIFCEIVNICCECSFWQTSIFLSTAWQAELTTQRSEQGNRRRPIWPLCPSPYANIVKIYICEFC